MAYRIKGKNGLPIKKDGQFLMGYDIPETKIEQLNERELSFLAVGSTEDEDRDKDIVRVAGWDLKNFKNNPVLPWSHNYYEPPVGKAISIKKDKKKKKLIFKAQFDADDPKAVAIFNKYKNGYLSTFSVGFMGIDFEWRDEENRWYGGKEFTKQELLEISPVTVPANPNANMDVRSITDDLPPSLASQGFKSFMCKTDSGLFLPIGDTEIYTSPVVLDMCKGVKGVFGAEIDNPEVDNQLVGYMFGEDITEEFAKNWVDKNGCTKSKVKFFDMGEKQICEEEFELDVVEEEISIDAKSIIDEEFESVEDSDSIELIETEEKNTPEEETEEKDTSEETEEKDESSDTDDKDVPEEETEEKDTPEETDEKDVSDDVDEKDETDENDSGEKESEESKEKDLNDSEETEEKDTPEETDESNIDKIVNAVFEKIKGLLIENKILVEKEDEIDNTEKDNSELESEDETETSKTGEIIEFDFSLSSPVSEKDNSEDFIELDEDVLHSVTIQLGKGSTNKTIKDSLEKAIIKALSEFTGRLED
jgi:HK97 family phage prohead protease